MGNTCMKSGQMPHQLRLMICTITQQNCLIMPRCQPYGNNPDCINSFCVCAQKKHRLSSSPPVFFINKEKQNHTPITHTLALVIPAQAGIHCPAGTYFCEFLPPSPTPRNFNKTYLQHELLTTPTYNTKF